MLEDKRQGLTQPGGMSPVLFDCQETWHSVSWNDHTDTSMRHEATLSYKTEIILNLPILMLCHLDKPRYIRS